MLAPVCACVRTSVYVGRMIANFSSNLHQIPTGKHTRIITNPSSREAGKESRIRTLRELIHDTHVQLERIH